MGQSYALDNETSSGPVDTLPCGTDAKSVHCIRVLGPYVSKCIVCVAGWLMKMRQLENGSDRLSGERTVAVSRETRHTGSWWWG